MLQSNRMSHPDCTSPGARPTALAHPRAPRWLVEVAVRCAWLCGRTLRAMCSTIYCRLRLPSRPLPSHPMRSWNHVPRDVPITGRGATAINVLAGRRAEDAKETKTATAARVVRTLSLVRLPPHYPMAG